MSEKDVKGFQSGQELSKTSELEIDRTLIVLNIDILVKDLRVVNIKYGKNKGNESRCDEFSCQ